MTRSRPNRRQLAVGAGELPADEADRIARLALASERLSAISAELAAVTRSLSDAAGRNDVNSPAARRLHVAADTLSSSLESLGGAVMDHAQCEEDLAALRAWRDATS